MKRALISVSDKTGILEFSKSLVELGFSIISTGGTFKHLKENGVEVIAVDEITGFKECLDGRVKTLHPNIHGGILAMRDNNEHMNQLKELDINIIDIVVCNLYPFKETILKPNVSMEDAIENIDIGGPSMIRAAAKNYKFVSVLTDVADYEKVITEIKENGHVSEKTNLSLSTKAFSHTAHYDTLISNYLTKITGENALPETITLTYEKSQSMRYGENPHQNAAFYKEIPVPVGSLASAVQIHGKELSFNNINDTNGALELLKEFLEPTVVACKHSNPCAVSSACKVLYAYQNAYSADPVSIFGGIIAVNREIDEETANEMSKTFIEVIIAPSFSEKALEILMKKKNIRLLTLGDIDKKQSTDSLDIKKVSGGILVQEVNNELFDDLEFVTERHPSQIELMDLVFAFKAVKHTKSNAIVIGKNRMTLGIGVGQVSRIWATKQAIDHAKEHLGEDALKGSVMASDAFFPFTDCIEEAIAAGVTAVIHPGGSVNDQLSIDLCNKHNIAMVIAGKRHFRH
ncbi:MAG: bifunctional phosphoribosylaminoimidazolecarboxamide formyltransferase/IMP cyclohydrolase [Defluviitaleaceae bacterium]|nr:bifunctional phosphoribosylaminoimidazolecarboxamide formyltransferase/IMP cyclohydrolase [Defluviitaleaceae bacterium]